MKFLFYFSHPAQYLSSRETVKKLLAKEAHRVTVLIKTKDVLEELITQDGIDFINILPEERGKSRLAMFLSLLKRLIIVLPILVKIRPDLLIGTDAVLAHLGFLLRINRITILEDDYAVIKNMANLLYPFTQTILCPEVCDVGNWQSKKVGYEGYMKLGYLHPSVFSADATIPWKYSIGTNYALIRLSKLSAYHDIGISGINQGILDEIIQLIEQKNYRVFISAEGELPGKYRLYQLLINPVDIHHILAHAIVLISDSQSMSVEAAVLGVPSIRYSSLVGKLSVLDELERKYGLTFGVEIGNSKLLLSKLGELINCENLYHDFQLKRQRMLREKIDVTPFWIWFFENYPKSKWEMLKEKELKSTKMPTISR